MKKRATDSKPKGDRNVFTHSPLDPNCEDDQNHTRQMQTHTSDTRRWVSLPTPFGDLITADHKVLNLGQESRNNDQYALIVQDECWYWTQSYPTKRKDAAETL